MPPIIISDVYTQLLYSMSYIYEALKDYENAIHYAKLAKIILSSFREKEHDLLFSVGTQFYFSYKNTNKL